MKRRLVGTVSSDRMDKTVVVRVTRRTPHARYGKILQRTSKFKAHDPQNACKKGDRVVIEESRPLSREKRWRVVEIIQESRAEEVGS